jgi:F1F0 ATPase subunit 2
MIDWIMWLAPLLSGVLLGAFYFAGLWWTVGRLSHTRHPLACYLLSFGIRIAVLLLAFFFLLNVGVLELLTALAGFVATRFALVRSLGLTARSDLRLPGQSTSSSPPRMGAG